ncbi:MAG: bifunctional demethylmenaquinone methyltransferase/2-methoxy-6-polyprenyl-1,4-benzoquinol methylase UbiE [Chthoniobacterales bacterium]|nr:bifunctional demethylmenaquinone methyltransferase/2-methoxy-6-polyprenyl-1,4-benzoquinol methylase UbiE [Chthoniobacterales bacterium]
MTSENIQKLFASIAPRYALANHLLSGGIDYWWRYHVTKKIATWKPKELLDVATGDGALAFAIAKKNRTTKIIGVDFCREMLACADQTKAKKKNDLITFLEADGMELPFDEKSFDVVTIAFGLRNMDSFERALSEMRRVLRPGGHLLILDFSIPTAPLLKPLYRFYLHHLLPRFASWITGKSAAYEYMGASIETFPSGDAMKALLKKCHFTRPVAEPLTGGIVSVYIAQK